MVVGYKRYDHYWTMPVKKKKRLLVQSVVEMRDSYNANWVDCSVRGRMILWRNKDLIKAVAPFYLEIFGCY